MPDLVGTQRRWKRHGPRPAKTLSRKALRSISRGWSLESQNGNPGSDHSSADAAPGGPIRRGDGHYHQRVRRTRHPSAISQCVLAPVKVGPTRPSVDARHRSARSLRAGVAPGDRRLRPQGGGGIRLRLRRRPDPGACGRALPAGSRLASKIQIQTTSIAIAGLSSRAAISKSASLSSQASTRWTISRGVKRSSFPATEASI